MKKKQAADAADPFRCNSTKNINPSIGKIAITFEAMMVQLLSSLKLYYIVYFIAGSTISNRLSSAAPYKYFDKG